METNTLELQEQMSLNIDRWLRSIDADLRSQAREMLPDLYNWRAVANMGIEVFDTDRRGLVIELESMVNNLSTVQLLALAEGYGLEYTSFEQWSNPDRDADAAI